MNELHLFAGAGGGILGGKMLGHTCVCAVEIDPYCRRVLFQRQRDGALPRFPIWDDVRTFHGEPWRGLVDVVCGGFPCQDISAAGKGAGITGERSGLWKHMARIVGEVRPRFVFVENSPMLVKRGLATVLSDLATMGYDARWGIVGAHHYGAPHKRDRCWVMANANSRTLRDTTSGNMEHEKYVRSLPRSNGEACNVAYYNSPGLKKQRSAEPDEAQHAATECHCWWETEPGLGRVANGVAHRVDRLKAIGNGQVPHVAALAWSILSGGMR